MTTSCLHGFLNIVVLKSLAEGPKSGYSLMRLVHERVGIKPSPGSMYPLLDQLKKEGLVQVKGVRRSKEYRLTLTGKKRIKSLDDKRNLCLDRIREGMKMLSAITGEDMTFPLTMIESLKKGMIPFKEINPEWNDLREELFRRMQQKTLKNPKIKAALLCAYRKIKAARDTP